MATATTHPYLMSDRYCAHWTVQMAIRELIANAIDASDYTDVTIGWNDGIGIISNSNAQLECRHLLLGESDKKGDQIGQFGEGLKLAALVIAREGRAIRVQSGDTEYVFTVDDNAQFGCRTMFVEVKNLALPINGTRVIFACTKEEIGSAKMLFRVFNHVEEMGDGILEAMGDVYVMGVHICKLKDSHLGYDLNDKSLINRDRTMVDRDKVDTAIDKMVANTKSETVMENILLTAAKHPESFEGKLCFYPWYQDIWRKVITRIWGNYVCITTPDNQIADERASRLGYKVINLGYGLNLSFTPQTLKRSSDVNPAAVTSTVPTENLQDVEKNVLAEVKAIMEYLLGRKLSVTLHITEDLADETVMQMQGSDFYVNRRYLTKPVSWLAGSAMHELGHLESGGVDCSKEFQQKLTDYLIEIAEVATRKLLR